MPVIELWLWSKLVGAGLVLFSSVGLVLVKEWEFRENKIQLEELGVFLSLLQNEMCFLRLPLALVLEHCGSHLKQPYQVLCLEMKQGLEKQGQRDVCGIWQDVLQNHKTEFYLQEEAYRLLLELGELFRADQTGLQQELLTIYQDRLALEKQHFEDGLAARKRVSRFGTMLAGIFIIILFI